MALRLFIIARHFASRLGFLTGAVEDDDEDVMLIFLAAMLTELNNLFFCVRVGVRERETEIE